MDKKLKELLEKCKGMVIHGSITVEVPDTSGEIVEIKGIDTSDVKEGTVQLNVEHISPDKEGKGSLECIIGHCVYSRKIYSEEDCENDEQLKFYNKVKVPILYGIFELFTDESHPGALNAAAILRYYKKRDMLNVARFSIEGTTIDRKGNMITSSIMRRVALTMKPANRASSVEILQDSDEDNEVIKNESDLSEKLSYFDDFEPEDVLLKVKNALNNVKELAKTLTLGSYAGSPGSLTGGAALAKEDLGEESKILKNQVLAAYRDWPRTTSFKEFLKHRLPDVDERFIDKFSDMVDEIHLKKNELEKSENPHLKKLNNPIPKGAQAFKGKWVQPGEVQIVAGPFEGSKVKLVYLDDNYTYVEPFRAGDQEAVKVNKLNRNFEGSHFVITKQPKILDIPNYVDANLHSDPFLTNTVAQQELIHGINIAGKPFADIHQHGATEARTKGAVGWFRSAHNKMVYVKPAVVFPHDNAVDVISTAKRETIFHNLARDFFGLGEYVPTTSTFQHPQTGQDHSAMELVPYAKHYSSKDEDPEIQQKLIEAGESGILDKLAIMDIVMGHSDRHRLNYVTSPTPPYIHLIDNSLIFDYSDAYLPSYIYDFHKLKGDPDFGGLLLTEDTCKWLLKLDPFSLMAQLNRQGVPEKLVFEAVSRLMSMQSQIILGNITKSSIFMAHKETQNQPSIKEVEVHV